MPLTRCLRFLALLCLLPGAARAADGPYLLRDGGGWQALSVVDTAEGPRRHSQAVKLRGEITIPATP